MVVTRPRPEAERWAAQLGALGIAGCRVLPLIEIGAAPDAAALAAARAALGRFRAVMFVSPAAVGAWFGMETNAAAGQSQIAWTATETRAWATGPGTRQALWDAGVPPARVDAPAQDAGQFDSEALWAQVAHQVGPGHQVLIVRGGDGPSGAAAGRDWLAGALRDAGAGVVEVLAYLRQPPAWGEAEREVARLAAGDGSWWLLSSSQAVAHLQALLPGQAWAGARALATHPRIAAAAGAAGFGMVATVRPRPEDVAAFLQSTG